MSLTIELPPAVERRLRARAERDGKPAAELAVELLDGCLPPPTWEEVVAPVAARVAADGVTEGEVEAFFQEVRQEVWDERHPKGSA
jgi:hypothetical protein